ncbi:MAG: ASCH domain-containing protein [Desulfurellales bacterium]|nr:MAG: ASCH domain-containing protein [Desulfurellales bacterium]
MRNMSFAITTRQIVDRTKTVTRRRGWKTLKPGTLIRAVKKGMGLKPGEQLEPLAVLCVVDVRREPLHAIDDEDVQREGFVMPAHEFVEMFCRHMGGDRNQILTRIEFRYVPGGRFQ